MLLIIEYTIIIINQLEPIFLYHHIATQILKKLLLFNKYLYLYSIIFSDKSKNRNTENRCDFQLFLLGNRNYKKKNPNRHNFSAFWIVFIFLRFICVLYTPRFFY